MADTAREKYEIADIEATDRLISEGKEERSGWSRFSVSLNNITYS
jgi:hypothetical protein